MTIIDTDICLALLTGNEITLKSIEAITDEVCITWITEQELYTAAFRSEEPAQNHTLVEKFILTVRVIYPDSRTLSALALFKQQLNKQNETFSESDCVQYITARTLSARFLTMHKPRYQFS